jgi:hypothetical protein
MADLNDKLVAIEEKLGGTEPMPVGTQDALGWHLDYIESLIDGGGSGGTKLYKHHITFSSQDGDDADFYMIDKSNNPLQLTEDFELVVAENCLSISADFSGNILWFDEPVKISYVKSSNVIYVYTKVNSNVMFTLSNFNDTVTEL